MWDYHIHTKRCGHARGEMEQYVEEALKRGLRAMAFTDHVPMYFQRPDPSIAMAHEDLEKYVKDVLSLKERYPEIKILLGLEADYIPGKEEKLERMLEPYPWDYLLGSIHWIGDWGFDNPELISEYGNRDLVAIYREYYDLLKGAAASGLFDSLAHPDLIKKFGFRIAPDLEAALIREVLEVVSVNQVCLEASTAGWRYPANEQYPSKAFLKLAFEKGISVTLGSDAHAPEQVGLDFLRITGLLKEIGYKEVATFHRRMKKMEVLG